MKKVLIIFLLAVPVAKAQYTNNIGLHLPTYEYVESGWVAGDDIGSVFSNNAIGTSFICFPVSNTAYLTDVQADDAVGANLSGTSPSGTAEIYSAYIAGTM